MPRRSTRPGKRSRASTWTWTPRDGGGSPGAAWLGMAAWASPGQNPAPRQKSGMVDHAHTPRSTERVWPPIDTAVRCISGGACEGNRWLVRRPLFLGATRGLVGAGIKPRAATATPFSSSPGGGPYPLCLGSRHGWQLHRLSSMCCVYYPTVEATVASDPLTESYS
jgi:hypothetical protein